MFDIKEFYRQVEYDHALCKAAQRAEAQKAQTNDYLAEQRATELNTYLTIFQSIQEELMEKDFNAYSQGELAEMRMCIDEIRARFVSLLADPQYAGRTGEIYAEMAEKKRVGNA